MKKVDIVSRPRKSHIPNFRRVAEAIGEIAQAVAEEEVETFAEEERETFVEEVKRQRFPDFNAAPLNPHYRARKIKQGLDPRVMIRTGHYLDSIQVFMRRDTKRRVMFHVGFHKRARVRDDKGKPLPFLLRHLARVHEEGSAKLNIPRRRHWRPHYEAMRGRAPRVRARIRAQVRARARKKFPAVLA